MPDSRIRLLEHLPLFEGLTPRQLAAIVDIARKAFFEPGDSLIRANRSGDTAFVIMTGLARCLAPTGATISQVGPGTLVGELAILVETTHSFTVEAMERLRALAIHRQALQRVMKQDTLIASTISDNLVLRLRAVARELRTVDALLARVERNGISEGSQMPPGQAGLHPPDAIPFRRTASR